MERTGARDSEIITHTSTSIEKWIIGNPRVDVTMLGSVDGIDI